MTPSEASQISEYLKNNLHDLSQVLQLGLDTKPFEMHGTVCLQDVIASEMGTIPDSSWWAENVLTHLGQSLYDLPGKITL